MKIYTHTTTYLHIRAVLKEIVIVKPAVLKEVMKVKFYGEYDFVA